MSFTVAVVAPPIPEGDAEAWQTLDSLIDEQGPPPPAVFRELHDRLTACYPCLSALPDDRIDDGVWSDGPLWNNFGHRAAVLGIAYERAEEVLPFVVETATGLGLTVFDGQSNQVHRGDGIKGLTLTVEDEPALKAPTPRQVSATVDRMTPDGGPGFLILEGPGEDYAQVAGGDGVYTAEWREYAGKSFRHWVAGRTGVPAGKETEVPTNGGSVVVLGNERLDAAGVKAILAEFARGRGRPSQFTWRDVTDRFA